MSAAKALQQLAVASFDSQMESIFTSIPCVIVNVRDDLTGMMVDIQPSLNQLMEDGTTAQRPPILGVPVQFPVSKTAGFTYPLNVGDTGIAVFSMRSIESWKSSIGYPSTPTNNGKFDKSDAIFIPGIQPPGICVNNPSKRLWTHNTKDAVLVNNIGTEGEVEIRLSQSGDVIINTARNVEVNCDNANILANTSVNLTTPVFNINGNIVHSGNYTQNGVATFNGIVFSTHRHGSSPPPSN